MSTSMARLTALPTEILEQILLHLPGQDLIRIEAVNRQFQTLTRGSPILQHKRDLFSAGLIENPSNSCDFAHRRKALREYKRRWSDAGRVVKAIQELPEVLSTEKYFIRVLGRNLLAFCKTDLYNCSLSFLRLPAPPVTSVKPIERWTIPPLPFEFEAFAVYPPDEVLVVAEIKERFLYIHFLDLLDGSPYRALPSNVIMREVPQLRVDEVSIESFAITGSRVMVRIRCWEEDLEDDLSPESMFVWDWKTGDLILDLPSADGGTAIEHRTSATFLDEFRIIVSTPKSAQNATEFTLFDTLVPHGHLVNSRRFRVPLRHYDWAPSVHVDGDRCLGTPNPGDPLTTDPAQALLVLKLVSRYGPRVLLIVRTQVLIECVRSTSVDTYVPWEEWERGAVIMNVPTGGSVRSDPYPLVQGLHVILVKLYTTPGVGGDLSHSHFCTFDLSRRGWGILPLWDEDDGAVGRVLFEAGRNFSFQGCKGMAECAFDSLGDGRFMCLVRNSLSPGRGVLHVWELV